MSRFYYDEIRKQSQLMPPIEVEPIAVLRYFDKIMHRLSVLNHNFVTAKEFAEMFAPSDGLDIITKLPENIAA